ncbi:DNA-directed RNA polymerase subunit K [Pyrobaculum calidifontis]|uniref:DNA-directed RNA polymerase subunit Rpo6 n=1 Tax=Pyrobaculum calidifontis (strain DSM 21063 / JCM 11548 / VA1) TaxID=410359 RepID=A3MX22_PYRCJ|nr:DNA-directed RNA polymerase subunit K [Pyrobaculum calidifontis]ABO09189.1 DNA-directed RNA polymerase, subunit K [Pyrobaculum calidifontis JCM 11548]
MAETLSTTELLEKINRLVDLLERALVKRELYPPRLTKYEIARIIGARATQLAMGAQPLVDVRQLGTIDPVLIAMEELRQGLLDFIIVRELPDGRAIRVTLKELLDLEKSV